MVAKFPTYKAENVTQVKAEFIGDGSFLLNKNSITCEEKAPSFPSDKRPQQPISGQNVARHPQFFSDCCHRNPSILSRMFEY
jgi:hypothetical protein